MRRWQQGWGRSLANLANSNILRIVKPLTPPKITGSSIYSSGVGYNTYGPQTRQTFGINTGFNAIRDNVRNILYFRKGEYLDNSDFGVGLQDYLFEEEDELLDLALSQEIRRQFSTYEPRVLIQTLTIGTYAWADNAIAVNMRLLINQVVVTGLAVSNGNFNLSQAKAA